MDEANDYLEATYIPAINARFTRPPVQQEDGHVPLLSGTDLSDVLCREQTHIVSRDHIISFERTLYSIPGDLLHRPRPGDHVTVRVWLDKSVHVYWKDKPLLVESRPSRLSSRRHLHRRRRSPACGDRRVESPCPWLCFLDARYIHIRPLPGAAAAMTHTAPMY